jgi:hypothetical protein
VPQRLAPRHPLLQHADDETADDVDEQDDDAGDRITLDELAGAVHRAVEGRLALEDLAAALRLVLVDEAQVQIGVDAHLLAWHAVERESCRDFRNALRATGHDDVLHDDEDQEHDEPDHVVVADDMSADRVDHPAGIRIRENQPRRGDVQRESEQRRDQQDRRECGEVDWPRRVESHQQDQQRQREIEDDQRIEQAWRHGCEQQQQDADDERDQREVCVAAKNARERAHAGAPVDARAPRAAYTQRNTRATSSKCSTGTNTCDSFNACSARVSGAFSTTGTLRRRASLRMFRASSPAPRAVIIGAGISPCRYSSATA